MAADTIRFIVTVAIVVYKGLIPVVGRMLTLYSMQSSTIQEAPKDQAHKFRPVISVYKTQ